MSKPMSRAQMKRAAQALAWCETPKSISHCFSNAAKMFDVGVDNINCNSPRYKWADGEICDLSHVDMLVEASILLSEAHRPVGHDGDGSGKP